MVIFIQDDSQQRSWFLHEDEHIISELLEELLFILNGANADLCRAIIASEDYTAIHNLVVYYQMVSPVSVSDGIVMKYQKHMLQLLSPLATHKMVGNLQRNNKGKINSHLFSYAFAYFKVLFSIIQLNLPYTGSI